MKHLGVFLIALLCLWPAKAIAQLPSLPDFCQNLADIDNGKLSRSYDGGKTYVPIQQPRSTNAFDQAFISYSTTACKRYLRGEISLDELKALLNNRSQEIEADRQKGITERQRLAIEQEKLNAERQAVEVQRRAAEAQQQAIQAQRETAQRQLEMQRQQQVLQLLQLEQQRQQAAEQQRQMQELMRQQQLQQQQRSFSCSRVGAFITCN